VGPCAGQSKNGVGGKDISALIDHQKGKASNDLGSAEEC
jgi:hypothetical protein